MFQGLKGRQVFVNLSSGEALQGTVARSGWFSARLTGVSVMGPQGLTPAQGTARVRVAHVVWLQVL